MTDEEAIFIMFILFLSLAVGMIYSFANI